MQKTNLTIFAVVLIILVGAAAYAVGHVHTSSKTSTAPAYSSTKTTPSKTTASKPESSNILQTKTDVAAGQYLADSNGAALYTYGADTAGKSNCTGSCLYAWPAYEASNAPATLPTNVSVITRDDGTKQYAYRGLPLYTFTSDSAGKVTGDGVQNFHIAKP